MRSRILTIAALLSVFSSVVAHAQEDVAPKKSSSVFVYSELAFGFGNFRHTNFNIHGIFHGRHAISIGYCLFNRTSPATPDNFTPSTFLNLKIFQFPTEYLSGAGLTYGYVLHARGSWRGKPRFPMRAGFVYGPYSEPYDFVYQPQSWGDNYSYKKTEQNIVALLIKPGLEFTPGRVAGLSTGGYVVLHKDIAACGVYFGVLLGKVSNYRQHIKRGF